jgi:hypothetical protein
MAAQSELEESSRPVDIQEVQADPIEIYVWLQGRKMLTVNRSGLARSLHQALK